MFEKKLRCREFHKMKRRDWEKGWEGNWGRAANHRCCNWTLFKPTMLQYYIGSLHVYSSKINNYLTIVSEEQKYLFKLYEYQYPRFNSFEQINWSLYVVRFISFALHLDCAEEAVGTWCGPYLSLVLSSEKYHRQLAISKKTTDCESRYCTLVCRWTHTEFHFKLWQSFTQILVKRPVHRDWHR